MDQWEYRSFTCSLEELKNANGKKDYDWVVSFADDDQVAGINKILEQEGNLGWELVSVVAERTEGHQFLFAGTFVSRYRFFFKKRV